ncbi:Hpt domain-containing protein [Alteripontixanthobacter muriae]|uniref:Hpt domain-containing protein n=1 Tax=Alteripontixanthobacter muriae TaxID=2705546 RepID=UPI0019D6ABC0|nr:Hpt domain-containing protein [Alteripontixanthobacter muriae]
MYERSSFEATLAAAAGDDASLLAELKQSFGQSLAYHVDLLSRARCDGNWFVAAQRIRGLAASFHATELMQMADTALRSAPGDPVILRELHGFIEKSGFGRARRA